METTVYVLRTFGGTLIVTVDETAAPTLPTLTTPAIVMATFRDGHCEATFRSGEVRASFRDGLVEAGGR